MDPRSMAIDMDNLVNTCVRYRERLKSLPMIPTRTHEINIVEDLDGLNKLQSEWNEIAFYKNVEPWQSFSWMQSAAVAYSKNHLLRIITVRKNGRLTAIAPLVLKPSEQPLKPLQVHILGGEELKEPNRLISCDNASLEVLTDVMVKEPVYPIRLSRIPNDDATVHLLLSKFKKNGWITKLLCIPYPYIELTGKNIKKSLQNDLRRAKKKAELLGKISFDMVYETNGEKLWEHLETAFRIEASGWKGQNNSAILSNASRKEFFERYADASQRDRTFRLCFLLINNEPVAVQYAIESKNAFWLLNIGYDERFRACSPGNLLLEKTIKTAAQNGLARYNLLGKEEPWTRRWTQTNQDCFVLGAYRYNLCGVKAIISDAFSLLLKRYKDRRKSSVKGNLK
jgi:CelD/BcsL family acetyltransferase involved in cellulose biosynthesis